MRTIGLISIVVIGTVYALTLWLAGGGAEGRLIRGRIEDATSLNVGAPVYVAGLEVGRIDKQVLRGSYAELYMRIDSKVVIGKDAILIKRNPSLLSGPILEIDPGNPAQEGVIPPGGEITRVQEAGVGKSAIDTIAEAMPGIQDGARNLRDDVRSVRSSINTTWMERIRNINRDVHSFSDDVAEGLSSVDDRVASAEEAVSDFDAQREIGDRIDSAEEGTAEIRDRARAWQTDVKEIGADARDRIEGFDLDDNEGVRDYIGNVQEVDEGKGTLGELVNDDSLANDIDDGVQTVADAVEFLTAWQMQVGLRTEINFGSGLPRYYLSIRARRSADSYYLIAFEKSARGDRPQVSLVYDPGLGRYRQEVTIRERFRVTLQWAKEFGALTLRGGLKDSTMGAGADLHFFRDDLEFTADLFELNFDQNPRLKLATAYRIFGHLYVLAGVDDVLNPPGNLDIEPINSDVPIQFEELRYGRDYFLGYSLRFDDRDLAALLTIGGSALSGALND